MKNLPKQTTRRSFRTASFAILASTLLLAPASGFAAPFTTVYAAGNLGVLKSTDGGVTWTTISKGFNNVGSIAIDPLNTNTIYAGADATIYKTTNGGNTWTALTKGLPNSSITGIVIDPTHTQTIYASGGLLGGGGVSKSTDGGHTFTAMDNGLVTSPNGYLAAQYLAMDPLNPQTLYVTGNTGMEGAKTTNGAASWTSFPSAGGGGSIAINPVQDSTVYYAGPFGITETTTGGNPASTPWTVLESGPFIGMTMDPTTPTTLYAGHFSCAPGCTVVKTTDGGSTWTTSSPLAGSQQINDLVVDPANPNLVLAGDLYGVFRSTDGGMTWTAINTSTPHNIIWRFAMEPNASQAAAFNVFEGLAQDTISLASDLKSAPALACGLLDLFGAQVPGLIQSDTLSSAQGNGITQQIQTAMASIPCK